MTHLLAFVAGIVVAVAALLLLGHVVARSKPRPTRKTAPITEEEPHLYLWTPDASGDYRCFIVEDGQPINLGSEPDIEWTLVPARPHDIFVVEAGAPQHEG